MSIVLRVTVGLAISLVVTPLWAQNPPLEWSSVAKITNGTCADGAIARVTERAGNLNIKFFYNGKQINELSFLLNSDGSAKSEFKGLAGRQVFELAAGSAKRQMKISQLDGPCQWSYRPQ